MRIAAPHDTQTSGPTPVVEAPAHTAADAAAALSDFWDNFRDLGGLPTRCGRRTRGGLLFRSGTWAKLTAADRQAIDTLRIARVFDFRTDDEAACAPSLLPAGVQRVHLPVEGGAMPMQAIDEALLAGEPQRIAADLLVGANRAFVREHAPLFRRFLHALLDDVDAPQVFHCTAGKDRTGLAAALVLAALDVEPHAIWTDYLRSNEARVRVNALILQAVRANTAARIGEERARTLDFTPVHNLLIVKRGYLQAAFDAMAEAHGDTVGYLQHAMGLGAAQRRELQQRFTEPA